MTGQPVVLLHAGGLDSRMFALDWPQLSRMAQVLRYDRSGRGSCPAPPEAVDHVEKLRVAAATAFGERPVILVGSSSGGQLAVEFALAHPGLVGGLLLVGPGLTGADVSDEKRARMSILAAAARQGATELADAWLDDPHLAPHGLPDQTAELVRTILRDNVGLFVAPPRSAARASVLGRLNSLTAPGHVLVGELDDADNQAIARMLARDAQTLRLEVVAGAGHFPMLERTGWLPRALRRLLEELGQSRPPRTHSQ